MKKLISFFAIALFLSIPLAANANPLGTGVMDLNASNAYTAGGYDLLYYGNVALTSWGYSTGGWVGVFCISKTQMVSGQTFTFNTITSDLGNFNKLSQAAWVADNWKTWGITDYYKAEAQKAIWEILNIGLDFVGTSGEDYQMLQASAGKSGYLTSNWYVAYDDQDFFTPVPEPGILILLGIALSAVGLASRRYKF